MWILLIIFFLPWPQIRALEKKQKAGKFAKKVKAKKRRKVHELANQLERDEFADLWKEWKWARLFSFCCQIQMPEKLSETEMFLDHQGLFDPDQFCLAFINQYIPVKTYFSLYLCHSRRESLNLSFSLLVLKRSRCKQIALIWTAS